MNNLIPMLGQMFCVLILAVLLSKSKQEVKKCDKYIEIQEKSIEVLIKTCEDWKHIYEIQKRQLELNQKMLENIKPQITA